MSSTPLLANLTELISNQLAPHLQTNPTTTQTQQKTTPSSSPSISTINNHVFSTLSTQKKAEFNVAANTKDPLSLKSFESQGASVQAKLIRLGQNPEYQKLTPAEKVGVRAKIYDRFVAPSFKAAGHQAPDKMLWLKGTKSSQMGNLDPAEYFASGSQSAAHDVITGAVKGAQNIAMFGLKMTNQAYLAAAGMGGYFQGATTPEAQAKVMAQAQHEVNKSMLGKAIKSTQEGLNQTNFFLTTHPRNGMLASAPGWVGEQLPQLPLYEAVAGARAGAGLTEKLATSKLGKFVIKRMGDAADGFIGSLASNNSVGDSAKNAAGFAAFGGIAEGVGGGIKKIASSPLIKKWTAQLFAMGGQPLVEELAHSAMAEAVGKGHGIEDVVIGKNQHMLGDIAVAPSGDHIGHLVHDGKAYPYKDSQEQQALYNHLAGLASAKRELEDPLLHKLHNAERLSVESIAQRHFGTDIRNLGPEDQAKVLQRRLELIEEAKYELPSHVPELNAAEVQHSNAQEATENPIFARGLAEFQQAFPGISIDSVVNENQISDIEKQTGIIDNEAVAKKASKSKDIVLKDKPGDKKIDKDAFASHRIDTIAYFKNPSGPRLASDGTTIGGRDKRSWNERLKSENTEQFVETLKAADGNKIKFENPYHRMLFHWSNRDSLPTAVKDKLFREMQKVTTKQKRYGLTRNDFNKEADWSLIHLTKLAQSGRLSTERNVFASTHLNGPSTWSPWQTDLQTEIDQQELDFLKKTMARHPLGKKALDSTMKMFQANRFEAKTPEDWLTYNKVISNLKTGVIE